MSIEDGMLRTTVISILTTDPGVRRINFKLGSLTITPASYASVAANIQGGKILCVVKEGEVTNGAAAVYDNDANTIFARNGRLQYQDERALVVHESTHACLDLLGTAKKGVRVRNLENETVAYLAEAIFTLSTPRPSRSPGVRVIESSKLQTIRDAAAAIVSGKPLADAGPATPPIEFKAADVKKLQDAIKKAPIYKSWGAFSLMNGV